MANNGFTPIQWDMLNVLADGEPHSAADLHACLSDELGPVSNIQPHLTSIRKVLRSEGQDIVCLRTGKGPKYRLVRVLASPYNGRK